MVILIILQPSEGASLGSGDGNPMNNTFSRKTIKTAMNRTIFILGMLFIAISLFSSYITKNDNNTQLKQIIEQEDGNTTINPDALPNIIEWQPKAVILSASEGSYFH